jgi:sensor histidine kinase YesM
MRAYSVQSIRLVMENLLKRINRHKYFLLFIFLFAYVHTIHMRVLGWQAINILTFTPDAALFSLVKAGVLYSIIFLFIQKWERPGVFDTKVMLKIFSWSLLVFLVAMTVIKLLLAFIFDTFERNFNEETLYLNLFSELLDGFIYGSFFLAYFYYNKNKVHQQQLANYHQALAESRIYHLKSQLNPHFLFNNLNVLDQLIEEDKNKASDFLNEFADIYRYVLQASEKKLVPLNEELAFAEQYFGLILHKYGKAYQLYIKGKSDQAYMVPLTLQLLLENAVQHNLGTDQNPISITIAVGENIQVSNNINLKRSQKPTQGRALNNLVEQYKLSTDQSIEIRQSVDAFSVIIPALTAET